MRFLKILAFAWSTIALVALAGCGGSNGSGTGTDPFSAHSGTLDNGTVFGNVSTASGKTGISLTTDLATVDVNNGQVLATANLVSSGAALSGVPVTFSIEAPLNGPATVAPGFTGVVTDSNGAAITRITTGNSLITTNVIINATAKIGTKTFVAHASFQIVRGGGVIMFTSDAGTNSGGQNNLLTPVTETVDPALGFDWHYAQLVPFKVTDSNGNPRVGVPVTISVYSINTKNPNDVTVDFLVDPVTEPTQQTITTDSAGQGIFNADIRIGNPAAGGATVVAVVFKAVTNDPIPVTAYVGNTYTLKGKDPTSP